MHPTRSNRVLHQLRLLLYFAAIILITAAGIALLYSLYQVIEPILRVSSRQADQFFSVLANIN